jgi:hypothetical protein
MSIGFHVISISEAVTTKKTGNIADSGPLSSPFKRPPLVAAPNPLRIPDSNHYER